jgi:flagellar basal body-associated protein FliL
MALNKIVLIGGIVVALAAAGVGGTMGAMSYLHHRAALAAAKPVVAAPKPIFFAELADVVVSVPTASDDPTSAFVQFAVQFSTYDPNAGATFSALQPIIKSEIISLLMNQTGKSLQDPATRAALAQNSLAIVNTVLARNANFTPANPFTAAYITNLVVQD